MELGTSL